MKTPSRGFGLVYSRLHLRTAVSHLHLRSIHTTAPLFRKATKERDSGNDAKAKAIKWKGNGKKDSKLKLPWNHPNSSKQGNRIELLQFAPSGKALTKHSLQSPPRTPDAVRRALLRYIESWHRNPTTLNRFRALGFEDRAEGILASFVSFAETELDEDKESKLEGYDLSRILHEVSTTSNADGGLSAALDTGLTGRFLTWMIDTHPQDGMTETIRQLRRILDFRTKQVRAAPAPQYRRRKVIIHAGPTNSGKTFHALSALARAKSGLYGGPLRLLAFEVYERLNRGLLAGSPARPANLLTGEDRRAVEDATHTSCTIEMWPFNTLVEVGVVDEMQLLSNSERGNAWTRVILHAPVEELHLCGEESAVPLIQALLEGSGDEITIKRYERLSPLEMAEESLNGDLKKVEKGDCVITFSRRSVFALKTKIEKETGLRCAVVYGALPPEVRAEQAQLFNGEDTGYDVMVATDAVGMGLNLKIQRIIFHKVVKFDGFNDHRLTTSEIKQIGGRAGRFQFNGPQLSGEVTTLYAHDYKIVREAIYAPTIPSHKRATIQWELADLLGVGQFIPSLTGMAAMIDIIRTCSNLGELFQLHQLRLATDLESVVSDLSYHERMLYMSVPMGNRAEALDALLKFIRRYREEGTVPLLPILDEMGLMKVFKAATRWSNSRKRRSSSSPTPTSSPFSEFPPIANKDKKSDKNAARELGDQVGFLDQLEALHRVLVMYQWLHFRQSMEYFDVEVAKTMGEQTESLLVEMLETLENKRGKARRMMMEGEEEEREEEEDDEILPPPVNLATRRKANDSDIPFADVSSLLTQ